MNRFAHGQKKYSGKISFKASSLNYEEAFLLSKSHRLLKTMIQMAHELSFEVTVEGVETLEQFGIIKSFEPKEFQGYYFKRPAPLNEIVERE